MDRQPELIGFGMAIGVVIGIVLGLLFFPENFALMIPVGVAIGFGLAIMWITNQR